ncbi:MAG: hypothetical protein QM778_36500 [Myxococcales bacterium]
MRGALLVLLALLVLSLSLLERGEPLAQRADALDVSPLPEQAPACQVSRREAQTRAQWLAAAADASWERVPFDCAEAPNAVLRSSEAEVCYDIAGDREGVQRLAAKRRSFEAELTRRFRRARLLLELARRRGDLMGMRREITTLLALSSQTGPAGRAYRSLLERLDRAAEAQLLDAKKGAD